MKISLFYFLLLVQLTIQANLVADFQNPLQLNVPSSRDTSTLSIKFNFPAAKVHEIGAAFTSSAGLDYKQYIGVAFPTSMDLELIFQSSTGAPRYSCSLTDGTNTFPMTPMLPQASQVSSGNQIEKTIAYCRLDETRLSLLPLKTGADVTYTLQLKFTVNISTSFIRTVSLFTSTSNNPNKIMIDSLPVIGSLANYGDYVAFGEKKLSVMSTSVVNVLTNQSVVYPNSSFDTSLNIKINDHLEFADYTFVLRYPADTVKRCTGVTTSSVSSEAIQRALQGTLRLEVHDSNQDTESLILAGISENLVPNRMFQLTLKGWTALEYNFGIQKNLEIIIYYKNTYSIVSYVTVPLFFITQAAITVTASHPEKWDIWRNGAWPITFDFTSNVDLPNGGYVQIQHTNPKVDGPAGNRLTFIASSCDFTGIPKIDNSFGKRPSCFPLRLDNNYPTEDDGSAIFFLLKDSIEKNVKHTLTVWIFADNCGGSNLNPNSSLLPAFVIPQFRLKVYKKITPTQMAEGRFNSNDVVGLSPNFPLEQKCWNNVINSKGNKEFLPRKLNPGDNAYDEITFDNTTLAGNDVLFYKEFTDWTIHSQTSPSDCDSGSCIGKGWGSSNPKYLYSPNNQNQLSGTPFLLFSTVLQMASSYDPPYIYFPVAFSGANANQNLECPSTPSPICIPSSSATSITSTTFSSTVSTTSTPTPSSSQTTTKSTVTTATTSTSSGSPTQTTSTNSTITPSSSGSTTSSSSTIIPSSSSSTVSTTSSSSSNSISTSSASTTSTSSSQTTSSSTSTSTPSSSTISTSSSGSTSTSSTQSTTVPSSSSSTVSSSTPASSSVSSTSSTSLTPSSTLTPSSSSVSSTSSISVTPSSTSTTSSSSSSSSSVTTSSTTETPSSTLTPSTSQTSSITVSSSTVPASTTTSSVESSSVSSSSTPSTTIVSSSTSSVSSSSSSTISPTSSASSSTSITPTSSVETSTTPSSTATSTQSSSVSTSISSSSVSPISSSSIIPTSSTSNVSTTSSSSTIPTSSTSTISSSTSTSESVSSSTSSSTSISSSISPTSSISSSSLVSSSSTSSSSISTSSSVSSSSSSTSISSTTSLSPTSSSSSISSSTSTPSSSVSSSSISSSSSSISSSSISSSISSSSSSSSISSSFSSSISSTSISSSISSSSLSSTASSTSISPTSSITSSSSSITPSSSSSSSSSTSITSTSSSSISSSSSSSTSVTPISSTTISPISSVTVSSTVSSSIASSSSVTPTSTSSASSSISSTTSSTSSSISTTSSTSLSPSSSTSTVSSSITSTSITPTPSSSTSSTSVTSSSIETTSSVSTPQPSSSSSISSSSASSDSSTSTSTTTSITPISSSSTITASSTTPLSSSSSSVSSSSTVPSSTTSSSTSSVSSSSSSVTSSISISSSTTPTPTSSSSISSATTSSSPSTSSSSSTTSVSSSSTSTSSLSSSSSLTPLSSTSSSVSSSSSSTFTPSSSSSVSSSSSSSTSSNPSSTSTSSSLTTTSSTPGPSSTSSSTSSSTFSTSSSTSSTGSSTSSTSSSTFSTGSSTNTTSSSASSSTISSSSSTIPTPSPIPQTNRIAGKYSLQLPSNWFDVGDSSQPGTGRCYVSTGYNNGAGVNGNQVVNLLNTVDSTTKRTRNSNFYSNINNQFDSLTSLPGNRNGPITRIVSIIDLTNIVPFNNSEQCVVLGAGNPGCASTELKIGIFTSCVRWVSTPPVITSIYTAIDIQYTFYLKSNSGLDKPSKNMRFIKLYPEGGVFNDNSIFNTSLTQISIRNHFAFGSSQAQNAICLIEIDGNDLSVLTNNNANTLIVWIMFGSLLETDYSDAAATYPSGTLNTNVAAYGNSSQCSMHKDNMYINSSYNTSSNSNQLKKVLAQNSLTNYLAYFGSAVYFTPVSDGRLTSLSATQTPLFIPYYCPIVLDSNANNNSNSFLPTVLASWAVMSSFTTITRFSSYLSYTQNSKRIAIYLSNKTFDTVGSASPHNVGTLRFAPVLNSSLNNVLYVFNGNNLSTNPSISCSGGVFLFDSSITLQSGLTISSGLGSAFGRNNPLNLKPFYAFGKRFIQTVFFGMGAQTIVPTNNLPAQSTSNVETTSSTTIVGVLRPTIQSFVNTSNAIYTLDKIAFSCASVRAADIRYLTNYAYIAGGDNQIANFILDFNPQIITNDSSVIASLFNFDITGETFRDDNAGNLNFSITTPTVLPVNAVLSISTLLGAFTNNSICGLTNSNKVVSECPFENSAIACPTSGGSFFTICCYNVKLSNDFKIDSISVKLLPNTNISTGGVVGLGRYLSSTLYTANAFSSSQWTVNNANLPTLGSAKINNAIYSLSAQRESFGKVTFEVLLGRQLPRDMKLVISGNFSAFLIPNVNPRCQPKLDLSGVSNVGDILFDSCSVNTLAGGSNTIVVTTKRLVYKCSQVFSKTIFVNLWPVALVNLNTSNQIEYNIQLLLNDNTPIALNSQPQLLNRVSNEVFNTTKPTVTLQSNLCNVKSVYPNFPGEIGDFTFEIDLTSNLSILSLNYLNEISIYWPFAHFGSHIPNVLCYTTIRVTCYSEEEGLLRINLTTALALSNTKVLITVVGVPVPSIDAEIYFACSINNLTDYTRTTVLTGTGRLSGNNTAILRGGLRFVSPGLTVEPSALIREVSTHTFRVSFDWAIELTPREIIINSSPIINVYFPDEYRLSLYETNPSAVIDEYTVNEANVISKTTTFIPREVTLSGNRISITLNITGKTFGRSWKYWDIKISQVTNPINGTKVADTFQQTTGMYFISLTNEAGNVLYKTHTNVNTLAKLQMEPQFRTGALQWYRGHEFDAGESKWFLDIQQEGSALNRLKVYPGRYATAQFNVKKHITNTLAPSATVISLSDDIFVTSQLKYTISTSFEQPVMFYFGCPCGTTPGYHVVNFDSTETVLFADLAPIVVAVDYILEGRISYLSPPPVSPNSSAWIEIYLSEPNVDELSIAFTSNPGNVPTAIMSNVKITSGSDTSNGRVFAYFSINAATPPTNRQIFVGSDPNKCYKWTNSIIQIDVNATPSTLSSAFNLTSSFTYNNADTNSLITDQNAIQFIFTPPSTPLYLFCALICINQPFPANNLMTIVTHEQSKALVETKLIKYYYRYLSSSSPHSFLINDLIRGLQYKMKCIVQSTETTIVGRVSLAGTFETSIVNGTNTTAQMIPRLTNPTYCAQFYFKTPPSRAIKEAMIHRCQQIFSAPGYFNNGCIVCTDSDTTYNAPGLSLPFNLTCPATTTTRLRFLEVQPTTNITQSVNEDQLSYSVCPVSHMTCKTDADFEEEVYLDYFNQMVAEFKNNTTFESATGVSNPDINPTKAPLIINDLSPPDFERIIFAIVSADLTGVVSWRASTLVSSYICYWQIAPLGTPIPSFQALVGCSDVWCGRTKITNVNQVYTNQAARQFVSGTGYLLFMGCVNDIPFAQKYSNTYQISSFTAFSSVIPIPNNSTNGTGNETIVCQGGALPVNGVCSSNFISMFWIFMLFLYAILI